MSLFSFSFSVMIAELSLLFFFFFFACSFLVFYHIHQKAYWRINMFVIFGIH